jgi:hypothetical protein
MAACGSSTAVMNSLEEPIARRSYGTFTKEELQRRRRHSSHQIGQSPSCMVDSENVQVLVRPFQVA